MMWMPDSKRVLLTAANRLFLAEVESSTVTELGFHQAGGYQLNDVSPDGNWIIYGKRDDSDSEVTPLGFRQLELGRIVGNPTSAAVIATGSYALMNGGSIRTPGSLVVTYDPTKPNNYGVNLENYGVDPDVWVENTPDDELKRYDRELKTAIDEVRKMLKAGTWQYSK